MKNNNHKLENMENGDLTRSRFASNGVNNKTNIKVGEGKCDHYGHPTAIVEGKKVGVMGVVFTAVFLAVWAVMPANGAEAVFNNNGRRWIN